MVRNLFDKDGSHILAEQDIESAPTLSSLQRVANELWENQQALASISIDDLIGLCDAAAKDWSRPEHPLAPVIGGLGLGFIPLWMRRQNLEMICDMSLSGDRRALDGFRPVPGRNGRLVRCQPRGLVIHWIAGNVPVLGMISALQGLLVKNPTLVKVARHDPWLLPMFLSALRDAEYVSASGKRLKGQVITDCIAVVYAEREDTEAATELSTLADVRVAWGGREAVESIMNLPRRFGTDDIIFGPKVSFVIVGREHLASEDAARHIAQGIVRDVAAFDQRGCNSPHTVFVESGGSVSPATFAKLIGEAMNSGLSSRPMREVQPGDSMNVLGVRTEYDMRGEAYYSEGMGWTVAYSDDDTGLATPHYLRTIFVRPVEDVFNVVPLCSLDTQSAGLAVDERRIELANELTRAGVERCPAVGKMSAYDTPWDGMFPMSRMVRWVSTYGA